MRILLDECVPQRFCQSFREHDCYSVRRADFGGKRNGELLTLAEANGFNVLITVDKSIPYQQSLKGRKFIQTACQSYCHTHQHACPLCALLSQGRSCG